MYKETLQAIAGIEWFPVFSLLLFVTVFSTVLVWTSRIDRTRLSQFSQLPLDDGAPAAEAVATPSIAADTAEKGASR
jgi:cytochrome c oxidase cbb3-type subunit 4